jgi:trehalose-6-phosphate hydrolase
LSESVFNKYGSVTVGEMSSTTLAHCQQYSSIDSKELSMVFNFHHLKTDYIDGDKWTNAPLDLLQLKQIFNYWQQGMHNKGWSALFWCNHDQPRIVSRFGDDKKYRVLSAKMLASTLHMMQGTPYIYQGEEIAMTNPNYQSISQYRDLESINMHRIMREQGKTEAQVLAILANKSRDNSRTPMQWNKQEYAGFSDIQPWIEVAGNYVDINVENVLLDKTSIFYHYQKLLSLRKQLDVVCWGDYQDLCPEHEQLFCYQRLTLEQRLLCLNNFCSEIVYYRLPESLCLSNTRMIIGNYTEIGQIETGRILTKDVLLRPFESLVLLEEM